MTNRHGESSLNAYRKARPDRMPCPCWCEQTFVLLTQNEVYAGRTRSCGRRECDSEEARVNARA